MHYENSAKIKKGHLRKIINLSQDKNSFVRSRVAAILVNFKNSSSKSILFKLACDKNTLVRIEAYDSLAVFADQEVKSFLENAIKKEKNKTACSYAILSWADVVAILSDNLSENKLFIKK